MEHEYEVGWKLMITILLCVGMIVSGERLSCSSCDSCECLQYKQERVTTPEEAWR